MKKILALILAAALLIPAAVSCGSKASDDKTITVAATASPSRGDSRTVQTPDG